MSVGESSRQRPEGQARTVAELPGVIEAVAAVEPARTALDHDGTSIDYGTFARELATLDTSMGGALGPESLVPLVLTTVLPGALETADGGLDALVAAVFADAARVPGVLDTDPCDPDRAEVVGGDPRTLVSRFEEQVVRTPDATALVFGDDSLTYAEFDARANRLAHLLIERGVGPDILVGLAIRRSLSLLIAMYAIEKAGGAYVPIDPDQPAERNAYVVDLARPACVLTTADEDPTAIAAGTDGRGAVPTLEVDTLDLTGYPDTPPTDADRRAPLRPDHLAYVIFTSGSTGRPKGVGVAHRAIVANIDWRVAEYGIDASDVVVQKTPFTFDVSVWEFFLPLQVGATLVVAEPDLHRDPARLARLMVEREVTVAHFVPSMLAMFVSEPAATRVTSLRQVFASGEALPARTAERLRGIGSARLHNLYGPTEAAVDVSYHEVTAADTVSVPIGRAVPDTDLVVLDDALRPVPDGVVGELYLGGVQLARGYLARPDLTAERFVAGPDGQRLYRTGDLVRRRSSDGALEYLGRSDFQVKVRGLRIELGEIESALLDRPEVGQAAVLVYADPVVGDSLVAYLVPAPSVDPAGLDDAALSAALGAVLPDYMVPVAYVVLDEFPLGSSGKLDRKALPAPTLTHVVEYREPSTATEAAVAEVFADLTAAERVGADDEFFALGGNSLLATRAVARINAELSVDVAVRDFFDASTVEAFAALVDRAVATGAGPSRAPLVAQDRDGLVPLSMAQQRIWFLNRLDPGSAVDNIPAALRLHGPVDARALAEALGDLVDRHEVLRTVYPDVDGVGRQTVLPAGSVRFDLTPVAVDDAELPAAITRFASTGFDVTHETPVRARLFAMSGTPDAVSRPDHVLVVVVHHIAADGFSMGPLTRDLVVAYEARTRGAAPTFSPLPIQYADFAIWQRAVLGDESDPGSVLARDVDYWRDALAGVPELLELPTDRPRPSVATGRGAAHRFTVPGAMYAGVRRLAARHSVTEFMVVHAALAVVLARLSNTDDVAIGTPVAGRGERALDDLVGMFVNTLVLRTSVDGSESFADVLARVRESDLGAFSHADVPFERLVEVLDPPRSQAHHPLFQVMLTFQNLDADQVDVAGLSLSPLDIGATAAKFDLQLTLAPGALAGDDVVAEWTYATDLFDDETVAAFGDRFLRVLDAVVASEDTPVGDLPLLGVGEHGVILGEPGDTGEPGESITLDRLFARQAVRTPHAIAIRSGDEAITYAELDGRVSRLARFLIASGVGPGSAVGLALRRSTELVVAMYAIVRAGGTYVPLDPEQPSERNDYVLDVAAPLLVLTTRGDADLGNGSVPVVSVDDLDTSSFADTPVDDADRRGRLRASDTVYEIFTSGSTGKPKGVAVEHRSVVNQVQWIVRRFGMTGGDVVLLKTPFTFDVSVWELFAPLSVGATIVIARPDGHRDPAYLTDVIDEYAVTMVSFVPSLLDVFLDHVRPGSGDSLRTVQIAGEALPTSVVRRLRTALPHAAAHNLYGPTEFTVHATEAEVTTASAVAAPIGSPVARTRAYVLDRRLRPVVPGVVGELYLSGVQLARGYVRRPDLTAERFVADPFVEPSAASGARMYRTGDLVRQVRGGALEYVGRSDFQVKLRGLRIELGEIEAALRADATVASAVVTVVSDPTVGDRLVGYVVPAVGASIDVESVTAAVARTVPAYMVPSQLVVLDSFPLNASGKLDRKALPAPVFEAAEFRAPSSSVEQTVAEVFGDVLGVERVGLDDDFFALGGNSLVATRVASRLGAAVDAEVPVRVLFEASTVAALAARLESLAGGGGHSPLVPQERPERVPLSLAQQRMWFLNRFDPGARTYNIPTALRLTGTVDHAALDAALDDLVARHEVLRTVYPESDGVGRQDILSVADADVRIARSEVAADDVVATVTDLFAAPFDLAREVPVRAHLLHVTGTTEHVLVFVVHHIASDGFSMGPLTRDLVLAYEARTRGDVPGWAPLAVQYADFAIWQRDVLGDESDPESTLAQQVSYWSDALAGLPDVLELPTDRARPQVASGRGAVHEFTIDADVYERLVDVARRHNGSLFMVAHAALAVVFARVSNTDDVAIGTPVAGRGERALDDLVGMFVNTLVLRTSVDGSESFADVLARVRESDLGAFSHADVPFERLVEVLDPPRSRAHHPLFQVMLTFQNLGHRAFELPGLTVGGVDIDATDTKFDLQFVLTETYDTDTDAATGLSGQVLYATDLFDDATAAELASRFVRVLDAVSASDTTVVGDVALASAAESERVLRTWNATEHEVDTAATLVSMFEAAARDRRDEIALVDGANGAEWTYGELDARVSRLARLLIDRGVGTGSRVAVAMRRSPETVLSLYAVQRAGGAYVPIDPGQPIERNTHVVESARPSVILTVASDRGVAESVSGGVPVVVVDEVDLSGFSDAPVSVADRGAPVRAGDDAYVIFTSGSTGRPKGVAVPHGAIVNRLVWMQAEYGLDVDDVVLQKTPFTFDVSVWEFFWPLQIGARLVVAAPDAHRDPAVLASVVAEHAVTTIHFVPSMFELFVAHAPTDDLGSLRRVFASGEALPVEVARRWATRDVAPLHNLYGPTEAAVDVTFHRVTGGEVGSVPIGRPVWNTRVWVLDARLRPVPVGVAGELYLSGAQLASGYVGRPDLTADRFVALPSWVPGGAGERMYRTGDLVRYSSDGELEYLGRTDFQVKLRGLRIELGEIESALRAHGSVASAVVTLVSDPVVGDRLVGYVVPAVGASIDVESVTAAVARTVPAYMVPSQLVVSDAFPLNASGKLDRKALPAPVFEAAEFRAPSSSVEQTVAEVFGDVLGVERVGLDDDFFALGGNSLVATRVASRLGAALDADVSVRELFEASTVAALAARLESLAGGGGHSPLVPQERPERVPLSLAQQRMWFLNRFDPDSTVDTIPFSLRLSGDVDVAAMQRAVEDLVARHEVLRTVFPEIEGIGYQRVLPVDAVLPDLGPETVAPADVERRVRELASTGFDLAVQVPVRARLLRVVDPENETVVDHVLVFVLHHIAADGFSMRPLTRDLVVAYDARVRGDAPGWAPLEVQYADFAIWQRASLGDEADPGSTLAQQVSYWADALAGVPELLELPTDRPRPQVASGRGAVHEFTIDADLHARLIDLARGRNASLFMVVHAALATVLARLAGSDDVAIGTPVAGRGERALDDVIGMFVNTLVLRTPIDPDETFADLVTRVRESDLGAFSHADVPFERLVEVLDPPRSQAHHPLFQVMLTFQNLGGDARVSVPGFDVTGEEIDTGNAKFDLQLTLWEPDAGEGPAHGLSARFTYATDLFDDTTVASFAERFVRVLDQAVARPDVTIGALDLLAVDERETLVARWAGVDAPARSGETLMDLFTAAATTHPERIAVRSGGRSTTYRELSDRVGRLSRLLIEKGVGPEALVLVALERSDDLVVALLAVLAAGGGYLPVDPAYPADRVAYMIEDARPVCALSWTGRPIDLPDDLDVVDLDTVELSTFAPTIPTDAERRESLSPADIAYVIYTSGSTGRPKGVAVPHETVVTLMRNTEPLFGFDETDVWTLFHSYAFDFSVWELWGPLAYGGTLVVVDYLTSRSPDSFRELAAEECVTVLNQTPSAFYQFDEVDRAAGADATPLSLRWVIFGGEALEPRRLGGWFERHTGTGPRLVNMYGITETTVHVSFREIPPEWAEQGAPSVVGGPLPGLRAYVLDTRLTPVPAGVRGELYIAGDQVTRGYLRRPDLTSARFVANPFAHDGSRLYRTGDVARWTPHGELEYVGRADDQVKVRGFRIELGEIEAAVSSFPAVGHAAVVVREDAPGDKRIVAYVVPADDGAGSGGVDVEALRAHVGQFVPDYMVPTHTVVLGALPLTVNGKLDRRALPAPTVTRRGFRAPRTHVETAVAGAIADVLGLDRVGLDDDFFDLGGNSLVATRVAARIGADLDMHVAVRTLFEESGVERLAAVLAPQVGTSDVPPLSVQTRGGRIPLSLAQQRMWLVNQMDTSSPEYNIPLVLRLAGTLDVDALAWAVDRTVARHETLRTLYPGDADGARQEILAPEDAPRLTVRTVAPDEVVAAAAGVVDRGFDVATAVPVRAELLRVSDDEHVLVIVAHHIATDGQSMGPLARDTVAAYQARRSGGEIPWEPLTVQYADFAIWQRSVIGAVEDAGSVAHEQIEFWRSELGSITAPAQLPTDRMAATGTRSGAAVEFSVDADVTRRIEEVAREHRASVFMVLHAALAVLVSRLGGSPEVVIGSPVAGRGDRALDPLVGMFVNTVALPVRVDPDLAFGDLVDRVRDVDLAAFANVDVPFEEVVDAVGARADDLIRVALSMDPVSGSELALPDLTVTAFDAGALIARFPLQLTVTTMPDGTLSGTWLYSVDAFDEASVRTLGERLVTVVGAATADDRGSVGALDLMSDDERRMLTAGGAPAPSARPATTTAFELASSVENDPDAPAVSVGEDEIPYREIDQRSSRLARLLLADGVGAGTRVGIAPSADAGTVVAVWAVAKAGAVIVPLDPGSDVAVDLVLGSDGPAGARVVDPDADDVRTRLADLSGRPIGHTDRTVPIRGTDGAFVVGGREWDQESWASHVLDVVEEFDVDVESRIATFGVDADVMLAWVLVAALAGAAVAIPGNPEDTIADIVADEWVSHAVVDGAAADDLRSGEFEEPVEVISSEATRP